MTRPRTPLQDPDIRCYTPLGRDSVAAKRVRSFEGTAHGRVRVGVLLGAEETSIVLTAHAAKAFALALLDLAGRDP